MDEEVVEDARNAYDELMTTHDLMAPSRRAVCARIAGRVGMGASAACHGMFARSSGYNRLCGYIQLTRLPALVRA